MVDGRREFDTDQVEPATSPASTRCDTEFPTQLLKPDTNLVKIFGRKRATTNTSSVGLYYTYNARDLRGIQSKTSKDT